MKINLEIPKILSINILALALNIWFCWDAYTRKNYIFMVYFSFLSGVIVCSCVYSLKNYFDTKRRIRLLDKYIVEIQEYIKEKSILQDENLQE